MNEELEKLIAEGRAEGEAKGRAEGHAKGLAEGEAKGKATGEIKGMITALRSLVKDGILTVAAAAKRAGMTEEAFRKIAML